MERRSVRLPGLRAERLRRTDNPAMPFHHYHSHYELYYLWEGRRRYFIGSRVYEVEAGTVLFISPGHIHRTTGADEHPHERTLLEIDAARLEGMAVHLGGETLAPLTAQPAVVLPLAGADRARAEWLLESIQREAEEERRAWHAFVALHLEEVLLLLLRGAGGPPAKALQDEKHRKVAEIADYIAAHYADVDSLDHLCRRFFVSKAHLCHLFKAVSGMTVQEYLTATRIKHAQQLLSETAQPVTAVAFAVGYHSITHFERVFRQLLEMTPRQYRAENRRKDG